MSFAFILSLLPFVILGFLPSVVWLLFYLRKDSNPESNLMIIKIFFYGILIAVPVYYVEVFIEKDILPNMFFIPSFFILFLDYFIVIGLTEEIFKYVPFRMGVLKNAELDEPVDIVLYMIIAGLGFAAAENILFFFSEYPNLLRATGFAVLRFISGTFFHALASGTFGYFIALSFFKLKNRRKLFFCGLIIATVLHGFYNLFIMEYSGYLQIVLPLIILVGFGVFLSFLAFPHLKTIKGVCLLQKK